MELDFFITVILSGIMATYCLLAMAAWAGSLGIPRLDFAKAMTNLTYKESFNGEPPYFPGHVIIYFNGVFFALLYATAVGPILPGGSDLGLPWANDLVRGAIWGVILFLISGVFYVPFVLKEGFFLSHVHKNAWITSLMVHGIWGLVIGWLCPIQAAPG